MPVELRPALAHVSVGATSRRWAGGDEGWPDRVLWALTSSRKSSVCSAKPVCGGRGSGVAGYWFVMLVAATYGRVACVSRRAWCGPAVGPQSVLGGLSRAYASFNQL